MPTLCTKCPIEAFSKTSQIETSLFCYRFFNYFHLCLLQVFPLTKASLLKNRQSEKELECPNLPGSLAFQPLWPSPWPPPMLSRPLWPLPMLYSHFICITESYSLFLATPSIDPPGGPGSVYRCDWLWVPSHLWLQECEPQHPWEKDAGSEISEMIADCRFWVFGVFWQHEAMLLPNSKSYLPVSSHKIPLRL